MPQFKIKLYYCVCHIFLIISFINLFSIKFKLSFLIYHLNNKLINIFFLMHLETKNNINIMDGKTSENKIFEKIIKSKIPAKKKENIFIGLKYVDKIIPIII